ncbi:MAG TPA: cytochrome c [Verrucomicrobiae bacterium]|nr:cytochrome c [Verrucomicrobiae bacterium]
MFVRFIRDAFVICVLFGPIASLHAAQQEQVKKPPATLPNSPSGAQLYKQHCAVCHGNDLKGVGPVPAPYRVPPDLTRLARRHGGIFPDAYVADVLRNGVIIPAHDPAQMPTWGTDFKEMDGLDATLVKIRIANLTNYIKLHQAK